jgi:hypothetical protein
MSTEVVNANDGDVKRVLGALARYGADHPRARIEAYRIGSVSVHARIVDPDFAGIGRAERHDMIWKFLEDLPEDVQSQMSVLLLLTPDEAKQSIGSFMFDHPTYSDL